MGRNDYGSNRYRRNRSRRDERGSGARPWILMGILIGIVVAGLAYFKMQRAHMFSSQVTETNQLPSSQSSQQKTPPVAKPPQPHFDFYSVLPKDENSVAAEVANTPVAKAKANENPAELLPDDTADEVATAAPQQPASQQPAQKQVESDASQAKGPPVTTVDIGEPVAEKAAKEKPVAEKAVTDRDQMFAEEKQRLEQEVVQAAQQAMPKANNVATENSAKHYILSLGAFKDRTVADEQRAQLMLQGLDVNIKTIQKGGKTLYRLWMGPYTSLKAAQQQQSRLQSDQIKSVVVKEG